MIDIDQVGVFLGLDVGKHTHHGHGLTPAGKKVFDKPLPNSEPKLQAVFDKLRTKFGTVLTVVDQPASIGALPLTVARDTGCQVAYLPGLAMRRIADLYPGEAKTDVKNAAVIADAARTMPHTLRTLDLTDEVTAELTMLVGFDQDLAGEANRIRGLLTQFHPSLERVLGPRLDHQAVTWLLERYGSPAALRKAGRRKLVEIVGPRAPRMAERLVDDIFTALDEQTVVVPGTGTLDVIVPSLAKSLAAVHEQRRALETQIENLLEAHPLSEVLTSMPGIDVRTAAVLLTTVGDGSSFPSAGHLAPYAGLAPATRQSGTSIHGEHAPRDGNRQLKRAMFLSAFAALHDPASRSYYDRCRARGKTHTQALLRLARHRISVFFAMLRDGTFKAPPAGHRRTDSGGKNKQNAVKTMVVTDGDGRVLFYSPTTPGSCADITHARQLGLVKLLADGPAVEILADAGYQGLGAQTGGRVITPPHRKFKKNAPDWYEEMYERQRKAHSSRRIRVEHGIAHLKNWRTLTRHLGRRKRMSDTVQAVASLLSHQQTADLMSARQT